MPDTFCMHTAHTCNSIHRRIFPWPSAVATGHHARTTRFTASSPAATRRMAFSAAKKQSVCSPTKPDSDLFFFEPVAGYLYYLLVLAERKGRRLCLVRVGSRRLSIAATTPSTYYCLFARARSGTW
ncbi:hypothetical protein V8C26DRAFT_217341 [Trichoderma gracile]